jgi:acetyltransferase
MLYQIHRFPAELIDVIHLEGGTRVVIRPILPQDEALAGEFFRDLPAPARYDRFMSAMREPSPELLRRLTQVDYADHVALVAEIFVEGREMVIAEARYARGDDGASAEFGVSVAEPWQGKGLASLLLAKLACRAASVGIQRLEGVTLATNDKMLHLARKAGFTVRRSLEFRGQMQLSKDLSPPREGHPCSDLERASLAAA